MVNLKAYQQEAIERLTERTEKLLNNYTDRKNKIHVFRSPTGSGKTVMVAKFIENLIKETSHDLCFIWITIGKGDLHKHSKDKLKKVLGAYPPVYLAEEMFPGHKNVIEKNNIVVVNWESIRVRDKKTGEWKNVMMRKGEKISLLEALQETLKKRKIVMIIDESHYATNTERAKEIKDLFGSDVILEMSATPVLIPSNEEQAEGKGYFTYVPPEKVIAEGMIKKEIVINEGIKEIEDDELSSIETILELSYRKRNELLELFRTEGVDINPLVIIQIPNADEGDKRKKAVIEFLEKKKITEENGKLSIWLTDHKSPNLYNISEPTHEAEFLIFKQAVDTGWDCPRAHILVKLREIKSEIFEVQTIGRILRMPEQKHYENDALNKGYVFTNVGEISIKTEVYNNSTIIKNKKAYFRNDFISDKEINLKYYIHDHLRYGYLERDKAIKYLDQVSQINFGLGQSFKAGNYEHNRKVLEKAKSFLFDISQLRHKIAKELDIKGDDYYAVILDGNREIKTEVTEIGYSRADVQMLFDKYLKENLGAFSLKQSLYSLKSIIYNWFEKYLGSHEWDERFYRAQQLFILNYENCFLPLLQEFINFYKEKNKKSNGIGRWDIFKFKDELFFNKDTVKEGSYQKYLYAPVYLFKGNEPTGPEENFQEFIDKRDEVVWWWKNGNSGSENFAIQYYYDSEPHAFYPDYLIKLRNNRIGIIEIKSEDDRDAKTRTKAKAEKLQEYIKDENYAGKNLFGGIAVFKNGSWKLQRNENYSLDEDWEELINALKLPLV